MTKNVYCAVKGIQRLLTLRRHEWIGRDDVEFGAVVAGISKHCDAWVSSGTIDRLGRKHGQTAEYSPLVSQGIGIVCTDPLVMSKLPARTTVGCNVQRDA